MVRERLLYRSMHALDGYRKLCIDAVLGFRARCSTVCYQACSARYARRVLRMLHVQARAVPFHGGSVEGDKSMTK
jgi:hypothetical protein